MKNRLGCSLRTLLIVARQFEHAGHVLVVFLPGFLESVLRLQVIITIWQTQSAGKHDGDCLRWIVIVRLRNQPEWNEDAILMKLQDHSSQIGGALHPANL